LADYGSQVSTFFDVSNPYRIILTFNPALQSLHILIDVFLAIAVIGIDIQLTIVNSSKSMLEPGVEGERKTVEEDVIDGYVFHMLGIVVAFFTSQYKKYSLLTSPSSCYATLIRQ